LSKSRPAAPSSNPSTPPVPVKSSVYPTSPVPEGPLSARDLC
jgi:hypothetical protein